MILLVKTVMKSVAEGKTAALEAGLLRPLISRRFLFLPRARRFQNLERRHAAALVGKQIVHIPEPNVKRT